MRTCPARRPQRRQGTLRVEGPVQCPAGAVSLMLMALSSRRSEAGCPFALRHPPRTLPYRAMPCIEVPRIVAMLGARGAGGVPSLIARDVTQAVGTA
jgi:hypothetical protein